MDMCDGLDLWGLEGYNKKKRKKNKYFSLSPLIDVMPPPPPSVQMGEKLFFLFRQQQNIDAVGACNPFRHWMTGAAANSSRKTWPTTVKTGSAAGKKDLIRVYSSQEPELNINEVREGAADRSAAAAAGPFFLVLFSLCCWPADGLFSLSLKLGDDDLTSDQSAAPAMV